MPLEETEVRTPLGQLPPGRPGAGRSSRRAGRFLLGLEAGLESLLGAEASDMNQLPHLYLLPLEFTEGWHPEERGAGGGGSG